MQFSRRHFFRSAGLVAAGFASPAGADATAFHPSARAAVEQAHEQLFSRFVDAHGIILDYEGDLPTPEDCALGRPNAIGWWSPIENGPMFTGLYLPAVIERARRSGNDRDRDKVRRLADGLIKCASVSDVPGFVARGVGSDGVCHYAMGSDDQTHPWFQGLHACVTSGLFGKAEKERLIAKMVEVAGVLRSNGWRCPCDGAFKGQFRGGYRGPLFRDAVRYLYLLRTMHEVTGDAAWLDDYRLPASERPGREDRSRLELCSAGLRADQHEIQNIESHQLWIYVGCQRSLRMLADLETDDAVRAHFLNGLRVNAGAALAAVSRHAEFDNANDATFGHRHWRQVYPAWFPQITQADAERLAKMPADPRLSARKSYEARHVRNPLAAAAIIALNRDPGHRPLIERALCHYDYARLHMAEFLFAECAFFA
jgi:hypothetical protein